VIITPEPRNILRGISRQYIFDLCKENYIQCVERNIEPYDVINANEAFMTGTPFCLLPVTSLNGIKIGDGKMGKVTGTLLGTWSCKVGVNIISQIKKWNLLDDNSASGPSPYKFEEK
jgi:branched-chain amino acid aminotransferase